MSFLNRAHVPCYFVLHTAAVLFAELYAAIGAKTNDADEINGPDESNNKTGFGDSRVERLTGDYKRCGADDSCRCRGQSCGIGGCCGGLLGEDTVHEGRFLGRESGLDVLARGRVFGRQFDGGNQQGLECGSLGRLAESCRSWYGGHSLCHGRSHQIAVDLANIHEDFEFSRSSSSLSSYKHAVDGPLLDGWERNTGHVALRKGSVHGLHGSTQVRQSHADIGGGNTDPGVDGC